MTANYALNSLHVPQEYEFGRLPLIISPSRTQKRFAPWRLEFFVDFVWKRAAVYPRGGICTVNVANLTNGYAAEKGISKVVSDGEWKPYIKR